MDFDAIVIGGGHAGIEAALALSRLNFKTLMITQNLDCIGKMSCNPAIGGLAKGNVVREIDALGGEMARLIDRTMIQFRILNQSKGPAVQAPRAQADMFEYARLARWTLEKQENLNLFQDTVTDFMMDSAGKKIQGVITERGRKFTSKVVVLTTGTFMEASIFIGDFKTSSGRIGEPAACGLGAAMREKGFEVGRLKTGTPARVLRSSIDFSKIEEQPGDPLMLPFSFTRKKIERPAVSCYITYTNEKTHQIIRDNIHRSPLYTGKIKGTGPRYCPSIEDKVMRFAERVRHQVFIEPEGLATEQMYLNGISSSLPEDVQEQFLRTLDGFKHLVIMRPGYAVEYDYLNPTQLYPSLETKLIEGLFIAGQTNGTSGYEEAAAQGLIAGLNAGLKLQGKSEPFILSRAEAYIGVLIDDLVTLGTNEPYRLFTSRAEYRLALRHDTADVRLIEKAFETGIIPGTKMEEFRYKQAQIQEIKALLAKRKVQPSESKDREPFIKYTGKSLETVLKDPQFHMDDIISIETSLKEKDQDFLYLSELDIKYDGYLKREEQQVKRFHKMENLKIPKDFDYDQVTSISSESREKLKKIRPLSIGQAQRISGVRYSDISVLLLYFHRMTQD